MTTKAEPGWKVRLIIYSVQEGQPRPEAEKQAAGGLGAESWILSPAE